MKHRLIIVACALAIIATAVLTVNAYNSYQVQARAVAARQAAAKSVHDRLQAQAVQMEQNRINDECGKEQTYYNTLTPAQRAKLPTPQCNLPIVE